MANVSVVYASQQYPHSKVQGHTDKDGDWVKLVSSDGYSFLVKRNVATISGTLKTMLSTDS